MRLHQLSNAIDRALGGFRQLKLITSTKLYYYNIILYLTS